MQLLLVRACGQSVPMYCHEPGLHQGPSKFKVTKVAEALDEVDACDPKTVVRVTGLRALGDEGLSIVARYIEKHFGSVEREVPVISHKVSGQRKLGNFGFIVMSFPAVVKQILARETLIVGGRKIKVRAYAVKHRDSRADAQGFKEDHGKRLGESSDWCHSQIAPVSHVGPGAGYHGSF